MNGVPFGKGWTAAEVGAASQDSALTGAPRAADAEKPKRFASRLTGLTGVVAELASIAGPPQRSQYTRDAATGQIGLCAGSRSRLTGLPRGPRRLTEAFAAAYAKGQAVHAAQPEPRNIAREAKSIARRTAVTFVDHWVTTGAIPVISMRMRGTEGLERLRAAGAIDASRWERIPKTQLGSKVGGLLRDPETGDLHYAKFYATPDQSPHELAMLGMYQHAGFETVDAKLVTIGSRVGIATPWREDLRVGSLKVLSQIDPFELAALYQLSVFVDNADFLGWFDNIGYSEKTGRGVVIDAGASMRARSLTQLRLRPDTSVRWFAEDERYRRVLTRVPELYDPLFADDPGLAARAVRPVASFTDDVIKTILDQSAVRPRLAEQIASRLQTRRDVMLERYDVDSTRQGGVHP